MKTKLILYIALFVISITLFNCNEDSKNLITVKRVIDGDTFELEDGSHVRLIGIDCPEKYESTKLENDATITKRDKETIKKLGRLSTEYVKSFVEGKKVYLKRDSYCNDRDRYGRLLRYVYLEDGTLINAKILKDGYAYVYDKFPFTEQSEFREYFREARENNRGLWGNIENLEQF